MTDAWEEQYERDRRTERIASALERIADALEAIDKKQHFQTIKLEQIADLYAAMMAKR